MSRANKLLRTCRAHKDVSPGKVLSYSDGTSHFVAKDGSHRLVVQNAEGHVVPVKKLNKKQRVRARREARVGQDQIAQPVSSRNLDITDEREEQTEGEFESQAEQLHDGDGRPSGVFI